MIFILLIVIVLGLPANDVLHLKEQETLCCSLFAAKVAEVATREQDYAQLWRGWAQYKDWKRASLSLPSEKKEPQDRPLFITEHFNAKILPEIFFTKVLSFLQKENRDLKNYAKVYETTEAVLKHIAAKSPSKEPKAVTNIKEKYSLAAPTKEMLVHFALVELHEANDAIMDHLLPKEDIVLIYGKVDDPWSFMGSISAPNFALEDLRVYTNPAKKMHELLRQDRINFERSVQTYLRHNKTEEHRSFFDKHGYLFEALREHILHSVTLGWETTDHINHLSQKISSKLTKIEEATSHSQVYECCKKLKKIHTFKPQITPTYMIKLTEDVWSDTAFGEVKLHDLAEYLLSGTLEGNAKILHQDFLLMDKILPLDMYTQIWKTLRKTSVEIDSEILDPDSYKDAITGITEENESLLDVEHSSAILSSYVKEKPNGKMSVVIDNTVVKELS